METLALEPQCRAGERSVVSAMARTSGKGAATAAALWFQGQGFHLQFHGNLSALLTFDFDHLRDAGNGIDRDSRAEILRQAGERIRGCLREMDTVALLQESEFAILVNEIESDTDTAHVARRLAEALAKRSRRAARRESVTCGGAAQNGRPGQPCRPGAAGQ